MTSRVLGLSKVQVNPGPTPAHFLIDGFGPSIVVLDVLDVLDVDGEYAQTSHAGWVTNRTLAYAVGTVNDGSSQGYPVDFRP